MKLCYHLPGGTQITMNNPTASAILTAMLSTLSTKQLMFNGFTRRSVLSGVAKEKEGGYLAPLKPLIAKPYIYLSKYSKYVEIYCFLNLFTDMLANPGLLGKRLHLNDNFCYKNQFTINRTN